MRLFAPQPVLAALISRGGSTTGSAAPILRTVRLATRNSTLFVASTDGDRFAEACDSAEIERQGAICVDAGAISALIGRYPKDGVVSLELESPTLLRVKCGRSRVGLPVLPAASFPDWTAQPHAAEFTMPGAELSSALARLKPFASSGRIGYEGIFIEPNDGSLNAVSFNGSAMGWVRMSLPEGASECPPIVVSAETVDIFSKLFRGEPEVRVRASENRISFQANGVRLASKLLTGGAPPYLKLFGERGETTVNVDRQALAESLGRAVLSMEVEGALSVVIVIPREAEIELRTLNHKGGETREPVDAEIAGEFEPIGFSAANMNAILGGLTAERITIEQAVPGARYLVYAEGDSFVAGIAPIPVAKGLAA